MHDTVFRLDGDYGCPFVIPTEEEALAIAADDSLSGNTLTVEHLRMCECMCTR